MGRVFFPEIDGTPLLAKFFMINLRRVRLPRGENPSEPPASRGRRKEGDWAGGKEDQRFLFALSFNCVENISRSHVPGLLHYTKFI